LLTSTAFWTRLVRTASSCSWGGLRRSGRVGVRGRTPGPGGRCRSPRRVDRGGLRPRRDARLSGRCLEANREADAWDSLESWTTAASRSGITDGQSGDGRRGVHRNTPHPPFAAPSPYPSSPPDDRYAWFGTPQLWAMLELDGEVWDGASASFPVLIKTFWWSSDWPGMREEQEPALTVVATRLDGPGTVSSDHATNAAADSLGGRSDARGQLCRAARR